jgi:hypothetical protein
MKAFARQFKELDITSTNAKVEAMQRYIAAAPRATKAASP